MTKSLRKRYLINLSILITPLILIFSANYTIGRNATGKTFKDVDQIEKNKVGLVLGTSEKLADGSINLYFKYRIQATVKLFNSGKIDYILVSGDNSSKYYDEPNAFKNQLIKLGIPEDRIYLDYAGFRTLDSVVRAKEIFGQERITIISQKFHNERAIYLAEHHGLKAIGYNARDVYGNIGLKVKTREYLARVKVFFDLLFGTGPKYLGEKINIE